MSTEAQIRANRQNAQKSSGPRIAEGKTAVSQNTVKHGLFAHEAVIKGENPADYEPVQEDGRASKAPTDPATTGGRNIRAIPIPKG